MQDQKAEAQPVNNKDVVKDPNKNPFGYTTAQTAWRSNVLRYVTGTEQFKEDVANGVITDDVMKSWGLRRNDYPGKTVFHMIEDDIFPFSERRDVLTFTYSEQATGAPELPDEV